VLYDPSPVIKSQCLKHSKVAVPDANTCTCSNARLRGTANKPAAAKSPVSPTADDGQYASAAHPFQGPGHPSGSMASKLPPLPASPSLSQSIGMMGSAEDALSAYQLPRPLPLWLNAAYAKHIVKGNFMTLSARPKTVDQGEWVAHQGVCQSEMPP
jgi:hypothetical protein